MKVKNPLGHTSMKHHLYAVQALYYEQVQQGHPDKWSECYTVLGKQIMSICERQVKKISYRIMKKKTIICVSRIML